MICGLSEEQTLLVEERNLHEGGELRLNNGGRTIATTYWRKGFWNPK
jgi:hypothetical protein